MYKLIYSGKFYRFGQKLLNKSEFPMIWLPRNELLSYAVILPTHKLASVDNYLSSSTNSLPQPHTSNTCHVN